MIECIALVQCLISAAGRCDTAAVLDSRLLTKW